MAEFKSWQSYMTFEWSVKRNARYVFPPEVDEFLESVIATSESRKRHFPSETIFWRAQLDYECVTVQFKEDSEEEFREEARPLSPKKMKPLRNSAREGRANPKGIPCLYLATDKETAMAEVRPWKGSYVSTGQFKTLKSLTLIDLSFHSTHGHLIHLEEPDAAGKESSVWADIDRSFSEPITNSEQNADYVPTQILSELFRSQGYDGVIYKSLLGDGCNVALFDLDAAELIKCFLYQVELVSFKFEECCYP